MSVIEELFNLLAPHECLICSAEGDLLCRGCTTDLNKVAERCYRCGRPSDSYRTCKSCRPTSLLYEVWAATWYEGAAKELLHALKFSRAKAGAKPIVEALAFTCPPLNDILVTHVPTAPARVRHRGYDQSALIAKGLARQLGVPYVPLLSRAGEGRQLGQGREMRKKQMEGVFRPRKIPVFQNRHVLLVDDVLTTGGTCEAAARALRRAGAGRVSAAVFAVA